jgi:hypothetical protein
MTENLKINRLEESTIWTFRDHPKVKLEMWDNGVWVLIYDDPTEECPDAKSYVSNEQDLKDNPVNKLLNQLYIARNISMDNDEVIRILDKLDSIHRRENNENFN